MDGEDDTHRDHHGAQHVYVGGGGTRRVEVISGVDRRRRWGREEKSRIIGESFGEGTIPQRPRPIAQNRCVDDVGPSCRPDTDQRPSSKPPLPS
jgi:hypothetical protein